MAKRRLPRHPTTVTRLVLGHDISSPQGEAAARAVLYRRLAEHARWIELCEAEARLHTEPAADDHGETSEAALFAASHRLIRAGAAPPDALRPDWFPPAARASLPGAPDTRGRRSRRLVSARISHCP